MKIVKIFCQVDDFWKQFQAVWEKSLIEEGIVKRHRTCRLSMSEIMTIVIMFHFSRYRCFKDYYEKLVMKGYRKYFPSLVSYNRFTELMQSCALPLAVFMTSQRLSTTQGIAFVDSTKLEVCENPRIAQHIVFANIAQRGKTSMGWFYGFKLHLVINHVGEILSFCITTGNTDDRNPAVIDQLTKGLWGKLYGDKGYMSEPLRVKLREKGIELVTKIKSNMRNKLLPLLDKLMLRKRALIESVYDFLKNTCQIHHTRHRSKNNWFVNLIAGLVAYSFLPKKPTLKFTPAPEFENALLLI
jgi:Transposase DDE domain